jgi:hypothetical protein
VCVCVREWRGVDGVWDRRRVDDVGECVYVCVVVGGERVSGVALSGCGHTISIVVVHTGTH